MWFIGVEVEQETSAPSPKKNLGSAPALYRENTTKSYKSVIILQKQNGYQYLKYCLCPVPISSQHH